MDQIMATIQQAVLQQQLYNNSNMVCMPMPFTHVNPMPFVGAGYGYGRVDGQQQYPVNAQEEEEDEDEDDEEQYRTLFCNNLDERVNEEILYEVFLQAGPIESARIPLDNTGRQRNFGFVTYQHKSAVPFALELYQGLELFQKKITIRQQGSDRAKPSTANTGRQRNPFMHDMGSPATAQNDYAGVRHPRHSLHDGKQFDRFGAQNKHNDNDQRRRSDSAVMDHKRPRPYQHQQHNSGGNRRPDQRYNHSGKRKIL